VIFDYFCFYLIKVFLYRGLTVLKNHSIQCMWECEIDIQSFFTTTFYESQLSHFPQFAFKLSLWGQHWRRTCFSCVTW